MKPPSSTSSSDGELARVPTGPPRAALAAALLLVAFELGLDLVDERAFLTYGSGASSYEAAHLRLEALGPPDVLFVGSSRAREACAAPVAAELLADAGTAPLSVGNYGLAGGRASEVRHLIDLVLREGRPRAIVYGLTPRSLLGDDERGVRTAQFLELRDLLAPENAWARTSETLPVVLRTAFLERFRMTAYRDRLADVARRVAFNLSRGAGLPHPLFVPISSPQAGDFTSWQVQSPDLSRIVSGEIDDARVVSYLERVTADTGGAYPLTDSKLAHLTAICQACADAGVPLALYEVPLSPILERHLPDGLIEEFRARVRAVAAETGTPFVEFRELGVELTERDFLEQSHLNLRGSRQLTTAVVERIVRPLLRGRSGPGAEE